VNEQKEEDFSGVGKKEVLRIEKRYTRKRRGGSRQARTQGRKHGGGMHEETIEQELHGSSSHSGPNFAAEKKPVHQASF